MTDKQPANDSRVFVSYGRRDAEFLDTLASVLSENDVQMSRDIEAVQPGEGFQESIADAIESASAFVVLVSPSSLRSRWCQRELAIALASNRPVIPVLLEDTQPLEQPLSYFNSLDCRRIDELSARQMRDRFATLVRAIKVLGRPKEVTVSGGFPDCE